MGKTERIPLDKEPLDGKDAVRQYDKGARYYMLPEYRYFIRKILKRGIRGGRVLDIGTGSARLAMELAKEKKTDFHITGLDISKDMLELAKHNIKKAGLEHRIDLVEASADNMPFPDDTFDLVMSYASLHHWVNPAAVFREAERVVKKNGAVIIRDNRRVYGNPFWEVFIWTLRLFMNKRHRDNWPGVIRASYTIPEIKEIITRSGLVNYRIGTDFITFDLCVETPER